MHDNHTLRQCTTFDCKHDSLAVLLSVLIIQLDKLSESVYVSATKIQIYLLSQKICSSIGLVE